MKVLRREKTPYPFALSVGDMISLLWNNNVIARYVATELMIIDEAIIFEDVFEGRRVIGGMFVEQQHRC